jgi:cellulose synthase/poly-beta-1,6-N-acetylglucosamine synthase-like glycosyltransferase
VILAVAASVATAVPVAVLAVQCLLAMLPPPRLRRVTDRPGVAVIVPAHDEERALPGTLAAIVPQLGPRDRLLVVADNCTDGTADVARAAGADVLERSDALRRGKGYALDAGVRQLEQEGFDGDSIVIVDADCHVEAGTVDLLSEHVAATGGAAQAHYVMEMPEEPSARDQVSALAVRIRNVARARGMRRLGLPCQVTGSGVALPWRIARQLPLASGNIVEDMQIGLDLAGHGAGAMFVDAARVLGKLAPTEAAVAQRQRWEQGHLTTIVSKVPQVLFEGLRRRNLQMLALAVDLAVPPLSLLVVSLLVSLALGIACGISTDSWLPTIIALGSFVTMLASTVCGWWVAARTEIPLRALLAVPAYMVWKLPMWLLSVVRPQREWVRTSRDD